MSPANRNLMLAGPALVAGLIGFESLQLVDFWDRVPAKPVATACYGNTDLAKVGTRRTVAECNAMLKVDLTTIYGAAVLKAVNVPITQNMLDALTDFTYNVGIGSFQRSTLLRKLNAGDYRGASLEFEKWAFVGAKDCRIKANRCGGIPKRRAWEKGTFLSGANL